MRKILLFVLYFITLDVESQTTDCEGKFWTINLNNEIREWCLDDETVTGGNVIMTVPDESATSLGYCSDGSSNTFFAYNSDTYMLKYDGVSQWVNIPIGVIGLDNGGFGIHQYFRDFNFNLYYYNGIVVSLIDTVFYLSVADIAVDSQGRAWVFSTNDLGTGMTSYLKVYDKNNGLVASYPMSFSSNASYGTFFLNDKLYLLKGSGAALNPNTLNPISIVGGIAQLDTPIPFTCALCIDAASDNVATLSTPNFNSKESIVIYPNPASGVINISTGIEIDEVLIYDLTGRKIKSTRSSNSLDISELQSQIYVLKVISKSGTFSKIFEKK